MMMIETSCLDCSPTSTSKTTNNQDYQQPRQPVVQATSEPPQAPPIVSHQLKPNTLVKSSPRSLSTSNYQQHHNYSPFLAPQSLLLSGSSHSNGPAGVAAGHHQLLNLTQLSGAGSHQFNHLTPDARACVTATYLCVLIVNNTWLDCNLLETLCNNNNNSSSSGNGSGSDFFRNQDHQQANSGGGQPPNRSDDFRSAEVALESALRGLVAVTGGGGGGSGGQTEEDEGGGDRLQNQQHQHGLLLPALRIAELDEAGAQAPPRPIMSIDLMQPTAEPDKSRQLPAEPHDKGGGGEDGGGGGLESWLLGGQGGGTAMLGEPTEALIGSPEKVGRLVEQIRLINLQRTIQQLQLQQQAHLRGSGHGAENQGPPLQHRQQPHAAIQVRHMFNSDISQANDSETGSPVGHQQTGDTAATATGALDLEPLNSSSGSAGEQQQQGSSSSSFISWIGRPFRGWGSYSFWPIVSTSSASGVPTSSEQLVMQTTTTTTTANGGNRQQQQQQQQQDSLVLQIPEPARQMQILRPIDRSEQYNDISTNQSLQPYKFNLSTNYNSHSNINHQPAPNPSAEDFGDVHQFQLGSTAATTSATTHASQTADYLVSEASQTTASRSPYHQVRPTTSSAYRRPRPTMVATSGCRCGQSNDEQMLASLMMTAGEEEEQDDLSSGDPSFNCRFHCATTVASMSSPPPPLLASSTTLSSLGHLSGQQQQQQMVAVTTQPSVLTTLLNDNNNNDEDDDDETDGGGGGGGDSDNAGEMTSSPPGAGGGGGHNQQLATSSSFTAATSTTMMPNAKMNPLDVTFLLYTRYHRDLIRGVGLESALDSHVNFGHQHQHHHNHHHQQQRASSTTSAAAAAAAITAASSGNMAGAVGQAAALANSADKASLVSVSEIIDLNNETSLLESHLNSSLPIKIVIHGFGSGGRRPWVTDMVLKLLDYEDVNVIVVDWEKGATMPNYVQAAGNTRLVGHKIASLIKLINSKFGLTGNSFHLIGFSLGAHVAGFAGMEIRNCTSVPRHWINRITGLDPASPLFEGYEANDRLDPSDAQFVDVIHSNGDGVLRGGFGSLQPMGHVDFYPNGGRVQVGCNSVIISALSDIIYGKWQSLCNHRRALNFFMDSFEFNKCRFRSFSCDSYENYLRGDCFDCGQNNEKCSYMGYLANYSKGRGKMYLTTHEEAPFCANQFIIKIIGSKGYKTHWGKVEVTLVTLDGKNETFLLSSINDNRQSSSSGISLGGGGGGGGGSGSSSGSSGSTGSNANGGSGSSGASGASNHGHHGGDSASGGSGSGGGGGGGGQRELFTQHSMQSLIVAHPTLINFTHVLLRYTKYKGWIYSGDESWPIDKVFITDSDGQVKSFCGFNTILESHITTRLNLEPGNCTVVEPAASGVGVGSSTSSGPTGVGVGPTLVGGRAAGLGPAGPVGGVNGVNLALQQDQQQQQQAQPPQARQPRLFSSIIAAGQQLDSATGPPTQHFGLGLGSQGPSNHHFGGLGGHNQHQFQRMSGGGGVFAPQVGGQMNNKLLVNSHQILAF